MNRELPKLVRDKIPELYPDNKYTLILGSTDCQNMFEKKVKEELEEVMEAVRSREYTNEVEEFADLLQVVKDFAGYRMLCHADIEEVRARKEEQRGGFLKGVVLEECVLWEKK